MKRYIVASLCIFLGLSNNNAQKLIGAWELTTKNNDTTYQNVLIFSKNHWAAASFNAEDGAFLRSKGGIWNLEGNELRETLEFNTENSDEVGKTVQFEIVIRENEFHAKDGKNIWKRIDAGTPGDLAGAWLISGRMRDGELQQRDTNRPRKTMKILSGTRFQWIAYNTETKEFMGTGGGTYTTVDGKYTENIEFFSRDNNRVGANLQFDYELKNGDWHHSGLSSKGKPIYEVWSIRTP